MVKNKFRLIVRSYDGNEAKFECDNCHDAKATAGRLIHVDSVKSVCVAGVSGTAYFYINKDNLSTIRTLITSDTAEIAENLAQKNILDRKLIEYFLIKELPFSALLPN